MTQSSFEYVLSWGASDSIDSKESRAEQHDELFQYAENSYYMCVNMPPLCWEQCSELAKCLKEVDLLGCGSGVQISMVLL